MNTPSHIVINAATLGRRYPVWAVLAGAILPDLPIFVFYASEKLQGVPEAQIWRVDYDLSAWQPAIDLLHSFPLIAAGTALAFTFKSRAGKGFSLSLLLHALCDFFLHHEDAHRQFLPLSGFRFQSPVSYWDPVYHGALGAGVELSFVLAGAAVLARRRRSPWLRGSLALLLALYAYAFASFYLGTPSPWPG